ncbi:MAG: YdeI/OmpD-associated family protein [Ktedonobacterales bacterium]
MKAVAALPTLSFATQEDWEAWLDEHAHDTPGLWLKIARKGAGVQSISYALALESALCYGWIDGQKAALDDQHYWLQKFTPRRPKSGWSKVNREKVEALIATGRMRAAGLRQVERAKADGRWEAAYDAQSTIQVPPDFQSELDQHAEAREFFGSLNSANRYAILYRIHTAKKPATRTARIQKFIEMLSRREKLHP